MMILSLKIKLHAPWVHSLKEKRMVVKSLLSKMRNKFMAWELRDGRWIRTESGTGKRMIVIEKLLAEKGLGQSV